MATPFSHTLRSLAEGRRTWVLGLAVALVLLGLWLLWFFLADVAVVEVSREARLEVLRAVHVVEAPTDGQVVESRMTIGREVGSGDVLLELDSEELALRLAEVEARLAGLEPQVRTLRDEIALVEQQLTASARTSDVDLEEARARQREAEIAARFAEAEAERGERLHAEGQLSKVEADRLRAEADQSRAEADSYRLLVDRQAPDRHSKETGIRTQLARLRREVARLEGEAVLARAAADLIRHDIGQRLVRSPVSGQIAESAGLAAGTVVEQGDRLCTVVASGELRVVADFVPGEALGRIRLGQAARLLLDGFPWTQYGAPRAVVTGVAREPRDGKIRVELRLDDHAPTDIPLEHGLTGTVEVEIERVSPAILVFRAAGKRVSTEPSS